MFAVFVAVFAACGGCGGTVSSTNGDQARFEPSACPALPALANAQCGYLVVPENRTLPTGPTIRLLVATIPALASAKSDPVVYLAGGPGGIAVAEASILVDAGINRDRDLILMDQRGALYSEPALTCPDLDHFFVSSLGLPLDAPSTGQLHAAAARACYLRSLATRSDLSAYNTTESAADLAALRTVLGIKHGTCSGSPTAPISHSR